MTSPRDLRALVRMAVEAEDAGIDGVMLSEHIVLGPSAGALGRPANPRDYAAPGQPGPDTPWPDSIVLMSAIAAVTTRLRLIGAAIIAPLRHPVLLAHQLATLDLLSEGRLVVQPTVSWHREEYAALGVPFERRGELLDEHLAAWRALWRPGPACFRRPVVSLRRRVAGAQAVPGGRSASVVRRDDGGAVDRPPAGRIRARLSPVRPADSAESSGRWSRRWRRRGATFPSSRSSAGSGAASLRRTGSRIWPRPRRRSRRSSRPATRRSASSPRSTPTLCRRSAGCAGSWCGHSAR